MSVGEVPVLRKRRRVPVLLHGGGRRAGGEEEDRGPRGAGDGALPQRQQHAGVLAEGGDYDVDGVGCLFEMLMVFESFKVFRMFKALKMFIVFKKQITSKTGKGDAARPAA